MFWELLQASKGLPVTDPLAALWGKKIAEGGAWQLTTITGTLPLTVLANGKALRDYRIYGTESGAGVETENLFDKDLSVSWTTNVGSSPQRINVTADNKYYLTTPSIFVVLIRFYNNTSLIETRGWYPIGEHEITVPENCNSIMLLWRLENYGNISEAQKFYVGETMFADKYVTSYIPFGYKLPLKVTSNGATTDYPVYIGDSQLGEEEYVDYGDEKIYREVDGVLTPTDPPVPFPKIALPKGEATIDIEGELKPQAEVIGEIKEI